MRTHVKVDDKLIDEAVRLGMHKSKREAATVALERYISDRRREDLRSSTKPAQQREDRRQRLRK